MSAPAPITDQRNRAAPARRQHTRKLPFDGLISLTILLVALFLIAPLAYTIMRTLSEAPAGWADLMKSLDSGIRSNVR